MSTARNGPTPRGHPELPGRERDRLRELFIQKHDYELRAGSASRADLTTRLCVLRVLRVLRVRSSSSCRRRTTQGRASQRGPESLQASSQSRPVPARIPTARQHLWQYSAAAYSPSGLVTDANPLGSISGSMNASTSITSGPQSGQGTFEGSFRYAINSSSASASVNGPLGCGSASASSLTIRFVIVPSWAPLVGLDGR